MNVENDKKMKAIELNNSRMLDENVWSEYQTVDQAVEFLYRKLKENTGLKGGFRINFLHIKILILNVYDNYLLDPTMYLSLYRRVGEYKSKNNRYNKSRISKKIISIIDCLLELGLIIQYKGVYDREGKRNSYIVTFRTDKGYLARPISEYL